MASSRLGGSLKSARERLGWSREALAYHSGLSWAAITQIESGRRKEVRVSSLRALASALGVSVDYLVGGAATVSPELLRHPVLVYGSDDEYLASSIPFLVEGITRSDCVLAVTGRRCMGLLRDALGENATHVEFFDSSEWYVSLRGAASGYRSFMKEQFERGAPWIRIIGEPVWTGRSEAEFAEWFRYESMINLSFASSPATIVCTYDARSVPDTVLDSARRAHPQLAAAGDVSANPAYQDPEDFLLTAG
ncbi:MAG: MEDS domain-containing protein [Candidatus Dormiibacterota bacterium]